MMDVMRFTVVDPTTTVSFVARCSALDALVAACAFGARTLDELLEQASRFEPNLREYVLSGLAVFDEHNTIENLGAIHRALDHARPHEVPVFRVLDDRTREASLRSVRAGVVLFNLPARRIVQLQNTYAEIRRRGRVRVAEPGLGPRVLRYELPPDWVLVPNAG